MVQSPIVSVTVKASIIGALSNILAQAITAHRHDIPFVIDWIPVFQFYLFAVVSTPPNFLWQDYLEKAFPGFRPSPTNKAIASAAADDDKELDREAAAGELVEPRLDVRNTIIKMVLDQTVGAFVNTWLFCIFMHGIRAAMAHRPLGAADSLKFLFSGSRTVDYGAVDWGLVVAKSRAEFWGIVVAGWTYWPFVSLVNFVFVKSVETRNLVGSLAGVAWGVYISLVAAN